MTPRRLLVLATVLAPLAAAAFACSNASSGAGDGAQSCVTAVDCSGGRVCGYANPDGGGKGACGARGVCVTPVNPSKTMLCGCSGSAVDLVVDDPDAGVYYWSGVIVGEQGFPPCGDAAIAPSSAADTGGAGEAGD